MGPVKTGAMTGSQTPREAGHATRRGRPHEALASPRPPLDGETINREIRGSKPRHDDGMEAEPHHASHLSKVRTLVQLTGTTKTVLGRRDEEWPRASTVGLAVPKQPGAEIREWQRHMVGFDATQEQRFLYEDRCFNEAEKPGTRSTIHDAEKSRWGC